MKYELSTITIKELLDNKKYLTNINMQREYIYKDEQARYLLDSIQKKFPHQQYIYGKIETTLLKYWMENKG